MGTSLHVELLAVVGAGRVALAAGLLVGLLVAEGRATAAWEGAGVVGEAGSAVAGETLASADCVMAIKLADGIAASVSGALLGCGGLVTPDVATGASGSSVSMAGSVGSGSKSWQAESNMTAGSKRLASLMQYMG
jgi:hypothetical protein